MFLFFAMCLFSFTGATSGGLSTIKSASFLYSSRDRFSGRKLASIFNSANCVSVINFLKVFLIVFQR
jgi:hypothetical protein